MIVETWDDLATTPKFWDCDCDEDYIRPNNGEPCSRCGAEEDADHPDSRLNEIYAAGLGTPESERLDEVESRVCKVCGDWFQTDSAFDWWCGGQACVSMDDSKVYGTEDEEDD